MADEPLVVRGINWRQTFPLINLFRAFRVAVHPSKLVLALVALILLYIGGNLLDLVWAVHHRAVPGEVAMYEQFSSHAKPGKSFEDQRDEIRKRIEADYANELLRYNVVKDASTAKAAAANGALLGDLKGQIELARRKQKDQAELARKSAVVKTPEDRLAVDRQYQTTVQDAYTTASEDYQNAQKIKNIGLFEVYYDYESNQVSNMIRAVRGWNWFGEDHPIAAMDINPLGIQIPGVQPVVAPGVVQSIVRFFTVGPIWLLSQHPLYFFLFGLWALMLWSLFGGAISRIAAVHVARDEKLSIRSSLMFSGGKFLSFLFAPLIPLIIVVGIGLLVTAGSALANIPYFGPIIVGAIFILALVAGFIMALVLVGLIGGFNLMYPTVAVEGSDSFDAISRSFSYLYARPWRLAFYTLVSVVYGTASYLFVRLFIFLMLVLAHKFAGIAVFSSADSTAPLWSSLWPDPATSGRLSYEIDTFSLNGAQAIGAHLIWLWVHLIVAMLGAFAISFYFSSNTIIYYLMRREVDATDLDDVYLEQVDDEFADPVAADAAATEVPAGMPSTAAIVEKASEMPADIAPPT